MPSVFVRQVMGKTTYLQKFAMIYLMFLMALGGGGFFLVKEQNKNIAKIQLEIDGIKYQEQLHYLQVDILRHKFLADQFLAPNPALRGQLEELEVKINNRFADFIALDQKLEKKVRTSLSELDPKGLSHIKPANIQLKWGELQSRLPQLTPIGSNEQHAALLGTIHSLINYIGTSAGLLFDSEIITFYFMDILLIRLPDILEHVSQSIALGGDVLEKKNMSDDEKTTLLNIGALFRNSLEKIDNEMAAILEISKGTNKETLFQTVFQGALGDFDANIVNLADVLEYRIVRNSAADYAKGEFLDEGMKAFNSTQLLWDKINEQLQKELNERATLLKVEQFSSLGIAGGFALIGLLFGTWVIYQISQPLQKLIDANKKVAAGDWSARVEIVYEDEVGQVGIAFNNMVSHLQNTISYLDKAGSQLAISSTTLAAAAEEQRVVVIKQEATTNEIAKTAQNVYATNQELTKTMSDVNVDSRIMAELANNSSKDLVFMEDIMHHMVKDTDQIATQLETLNNATSKITFVVTTIAHVADRTNLLSLNAALEASKAKEFGKGFAVVAKEIRRIADQTAQATIHIEKSLHEIVVAVDDNVKSVKQFSIKIREGVSQVDIVANQLSTIIQKIHDLTSRFESVTAGMQDQFQAAEQITESIQQLSEAAQQTSQTVQQFTSTIQMLKSASHQIKTAMEAIKK